MKVSIIVPIHNDERYIRQTLHSISKQTFTNLQIIVIDDNSTDQGKEIALECKESDFRIEVYDNYDVKGVSGARNEGMRHAHGDFIAFVDGDDLINPKFVEHLVSNIGQSSFNIIGFEYSDDSEKKTYTRELKKYFSKFYKKDNDLYKIPKQNLMWFIIRFNKVINGSVNTKIFSNKIIKERKLEFNSKVSVGEDFLFCIEYIQYIEFAFFYSYGDYIYVNNQDSVMKSRNKIGYFDMRWLTEVDAMELSKEVIGSENNLLYKEISARQALAAGVIYKKIGNNPNLVSQKKSLKKVFKDNYHYYIRSTISKLITKLLYSTLFFAPRLYKLIRRFV